MLAPNSCVLDTFTLLSAIHWSLRCAQLRLAVWTGMEWAWEWEWLTRRYRSDSNVATFVVAWPEWKRLVQLAGG